MTQLWQFRSFVSVQNSMKMIVSQFSNRQTQSIKPSSTWMKNNQLTKLISDGSFRSSILPLWCLIAWWMNGKESIHDSIITLLIWLNWPNIHRPPGFWSSGFHQWHHCSSIDHPSTWHSIAPVLHQWFLKRGFGFFFRKRKFFTYPFSSSFVFSNFHFQLLSIFAPLFARPSS